MGGATHIHMQINTGHAYTYINHITGMAQLTPLAIPNKHQQVFPEANVTIIDSGKLMQPATNYNILI